MSCRALASAACGLVSAVVLPHPAWSQPQTDFPPALDSGSLTRWMQASTSMPPSMVVSIGSSSIIGLRSVSPIEGSPQMFRAAIWAEVVSPQTAAAGAYRSWSADVDVDCRQRQSKALRVTNYAERGLKGTAKPAAGVADWIKPSVGTQLYSLISAVCDEDFRRPFPDTKGSGPSRVASVTPAPSPAAEPAPAPPPPPSTSGASAPPQAAPPASVPEPPSPPVAAVQMASKPGAPAPIPVPPPPPPPPPAPRVAAAPAPKPVALGTSRAAVQVAAGDNQAQTRETLLRIQQKHTQRFAGLEGSVVKGVANGRTVYRALIHGFASRADADALCRALSGIGQACFVRNDFSGAP